MAGGAGAGAGGLTQTTTFSPHDLPPNPNPYVRAHGAGAAARAPLLPVALARLYMRHECLLKKLKGDLTVSEACSATTADSFCCSRGGSARYSEEP